MILEHFIRALFSNNMLSRDYGRKNFIDLSPFSAGIMAKMAVHNNVLTRLYYNQG